MSQHSRKKRLTKSSGLSRRFLSARGFSLIEVLVTILILTFGLIGVAGLLVNGIANASSSEYLTKANALAADMADRIRANPGPSGAMSASTEYAFTYSDYAPASPSSTAQRDKKDWLEALAKQLPNGDGKIVFTNTGGERKFDIEVRWSNCLGTVNQTVSELCAAGGTEVRTVTFELRL
jgi:type IV pilus assembly protein PilV